MVMKITKMFSELFIYIPRSILEEEFTASLGEILMQESISKLIEIAKTVRMNDQQRNEQRNSFVYGNTKIENEAITKEMVEKLSQDVRR